VRKLLLSLLAAPSLALASGYALPNTNPRDLGLSASAVAAQNDSGAAFAMPASLSRLDGPSARLSAGAVHILSTWSDPTGAQGDVDMDIDPTPIGSLSVAYGGKLAALGNRGWGAGLGIQPFGGAIVSWPDDWAGRYRIVDVDRKVFSGVLTGGVEVLPRVRVGGGLVYYYTTEELSQKAWMAPFAVNPLDPGTWNLALPDATGTIDVSGGALSFDVSAEIQPLADVPLTVAVDYKHKATQELDGDVSWENLTPVARGLATAGLAPIFADQDASHTLTVPNTLNIGVAYRVTKPLLVTATYTFDRWVVYDEDRFVGANGASIAVERNYSNGHTIRAGAEYDVMPRFQVRAGIQRDVSGLDTDFYSPTLPDASSWAGSLGATYKFGGGLSVDAAVFYAMMDEVTATNTGNEPPASALLEGELSPTRSFRGTYDVSALIYGVSLGWTPGAQ
jgi:long-chain fatty acid transport protein